ncbi:hypothetical protein V8F06_013306 [Rhypophila decipiens]
MKSTSWSILPITLLAAIAEGAHHVVTVGKGALKFNPENVAAAVGDTIEYQFFAKKHSVTQSSFEKPCQLLDGGFFSGFTPNESADDAAPTTFTITVKDTKPIWAYCSQTNGDHCQQGMVHSINAPSSGKTLDAFKELAKKAPKPSQSPPDLLPKAGALDGVRKLNVEVGVGTELKFAPNNITELPGTIVSFKFNPRNHSVVQSSFDKPCQSLEAGGFSSGFIPTAVSPSGATFDITVPDDKPIWFYCAQTTGNHCQSGMVGSINAPTSGNTLEAFIAKAAATLGTPSTIPPDAPLKGTVTVNGTVIQSFNGAVLPPSDGTTGTGGGEVAIPSPGAAVPPQMENMAGGAQPANYNWPPNISDTTVGFLQLLQYIDDVLLHILWTGHSYLSPGGKWEAIYPQSIVSTIGSMAAQSLVHRSTATDCLKHYNKELLGACSYKLAFAEPDNSDPKAKVDEFLSSAEKLLLLAIAVLTDAAAKVSTELNGQWLVPALVSEVGAKSRMTAVVNMMQNRLAAAAPREVWIPAELAWSYITENFVQDCPSGEKIETMPDSILPKVEIEDIKKTADGKRVTDIEVHWENKNGGASPVNWVAWIGPWGGLEVTEIKAGGKVEVPKSLYGHVWIVVMNEKDVKLGGRYGEWKDVVVAGPEILWVSQP